ncbi:antibiotic biosynthesis monooxygenase [Streptomyces sp. TRM64462]|uniref:antibiotic biosynthesis monooxygenase family protein n=1 Tax=Streptomyces sp. TRM64462 TaxID=2741726 RepID=UPI00158697A1|nr:antibiotic biosynthesis monooxygenase [Streptomyces sp. TRM64462]
MDLEPPYYAVIFTSLRVDDPDDDGYGTVAARMEELVKDVPGFLGIDSARTPGGLGITVGYFRDEESIAAWRGNLEHQDAQRRGREHWYERYSVHVAKVERSYRFERG